MPRENCLQLMTITSGNKVLGMVDGCKEFDPSIVPKDLTGAELCSVVQGGLVRKFIAKGGSELGKAGYFDRSGVFEIRLSPGLDVKTKATLLLTGYCIVSYYCNYIRFHRWTGATDLLTMLLSFVFQTVCAPLRDD